MRKVFLPLLAFCVAACGGPVEPAGPLDSGFVTEYLTPTRIVCTGGAVENAEHLLKPYVGQVSTDEPEVTSFGQGGYVLLDFGKEIQGGIQLVRTLSGPKDEIRFRIVLGESVTEALSRWDAPGSTATNDHAVRDFELESTCWPSAPSPASETWSTWARSSAATTA